MTAKLGRHPRVNPGCLPIRLRRTGENVGIVPVHFHRRVNAPGVGQGPVQERRVKDRGKSGNLPVDRGHPGPDLRTASVPEDVLRLTVAPEAVIKVDDPPCSVDQTAPNGGTDLRAGDSGEPDFG